jgi:hypothetical protein
MEIPTPPKSITPNPRPRSEHLKVDMRCQLCGYEWSVEFFGILWDIGTSIGGCPDCKGSLKSTGRASLQMIRFEQIDNPYIVREKEKR